MARGAAIFGRSIGRHAESIAPLTRCATADPKDSGTTFQLAQSPAWNGRRNVARETYGRDDVLAGKRGEERRLLTDPARLRLLLCPVIRRLIDGDFRRASPVKPLPGPL